jgi:hypothetical protein
MVKVIDATQPEGKAYVIVVDPNETPDTMPMLLTVAIPVLTDPQLPPEIASVSVVVLPRHALGEPIIGDRRFTVIG